MTRIAIVTVLATLLMNGAYASRMDFNCEDHMDDDLSAMACNLYWEARTEGYEGMLAVAAVTMWRVADPKFPNTIAGVVWEKRWSRRHGRYYPQFQWTRDGKRDRPFANEHKQWAMAWRIASHFAVSSFRRERLCQPIIEATTRMREHLKAQGAIVSDKPVECQPYRALIAARMEKLESMDNTNKAVMYHADYVQPAWRKSPVFHKTSVVGRHIFYARAN